MSTKRIQINNVVQNQLPGYVRSDYPLVAEFLKSYYQGQEYQGGPIDLVQNIDQYTKVNEQVGLTEYVGLGASIGIVNDTIEVDMKNNPTGTLGFPNSYGLLKINNEIIKNFGFQTMLANIPPHARIRKLVLSPVNADTPIDNNPIIPENMPALLFLLTAIAIKTQNKGSETLAI